MDNLDYFSHPLEGYGQDGLPLRPIPEPTCTNCGAYINDDNRPKICHSCGTVGCQECLKETENENIYLCRSKSNKKLFKEQCFDEYCKEFAS
jgi:hypothetical protein